MITKIRANAVDLSGLAPPGKAKAKVKKAVSATRYQNAWRDEGVDVETRAKEFVQFLLPLITVNDLFESKVSDPDFLVEFRMMSALTLGRLERHERLQTIALTLNYIAEMMRAGKVVLLPEQDAKLFELMTFAQNIAESLAPPSQNAGDQTKTWPPKRRWREGNPKETARSYFNEHISPIPFAHRPSVEVAATFDPAFVRALQSYVSAQNKRGKYTEGEAGKARLFSELFPGKLLHRAIASGRLTSSTPS